MKKKTTLLFVLALYIPLFLVLVIYIFDSLLWHNESTYLIEKPTVSSMSDFKKLSIGGTVNLQLEDINNLIKTIIPEGYSKDSLHIESITCDMNNSKVKFFAPVTYNKTKLLLTTEGKLEYEKKMLYYYPDYIKVGKIPIPKFIAYNTLKKYVPYFNKDMKRIEISLDNIPIEIDSINIKDNIIEMRIRNFDLNNLNLILPKENLTENKEKAIKEAPILKDPNTSLPKLNEGHTNEGNKNSELLEETKNQLETAYSAAKAEKVKEIIKALETTVDKITLDETYTYKEDAKIIKKKYDNLNTEEKSALKIALLNNMKFKTMVNLKDMFGL